MVFTLIKISWISFILILVCFSPVSFAFDYHYENTPAMDAFSYDKKSDLKFINDAVLVDGKITSNPPGTSFYDRYLLGVSKLSNNLAIQSNLALRWQLGAETVIIRQKEDAEPPIDNSGIRNLGVGLLELSYTTGSSIDLVAGAQYKYNDAYTETLETTDFISTKNFDSAGLLIPRAGLYKKTSSYGGGVFYEGAAKDTRNVVTTAFDDSTLEAEDEIHSPPVIGVAARFKTSKFFMELDFAAVQASESSPQTEEGDKLEEDHVRIRLAADYPMGNGLNIRATAMHKTLSYADNGFMTLDTIPMSSLHLKIKKTLSRFYAQAGVGYGYGYDLQSVQEFNAKYILQSYAAHLSLGLSF